MSRWTKLRKIRQQKKQARLDRTKKYLEMKREHLLRLIDDCEKEGKIPKAECDDLRKKLEVPL